MTLIPLATGARMLVEEIDATDRDVLTVIGGSASAEGALSGAHERSVRVDVRVSAASHPISPITAWLACQWCLWCSPQSGWFELRKRADPP
ncbi:MAG: hypothetical protein U0165_05215 [Polyangiaceae bacterium]